VPSTREKPHSFEAPFSSVCASQARSLSDVYVLALIAVPLAQLCRPTPSGDHASLHHVLTVPIHGGLVGANGALLSISSCGLVW
jgi:hypothetical protein